MSLRIIKAGLLDTVQDSGRWGYQHLGVTVGGAMDRFSAQLANALLGKALSVPVIEMHFPAAAIAFEQTTMICLTGADFTPLINGDPIPLHQPLIVNKGTALTFVQLKSGARCYLSVLHTLDLTTWLGSYATAANIGAGGYKGRSLQNGDTIEFKDSLQLKHLVKDKPWMALPWMAIAISQRLNVQFTIGNEWNRLSTKAQTVFLNNKFTISTQSDRMGYRLSGQPIEMDALPQLVSSAVSFGTIQLLPNGQLILLMADHQTTGGYPRIGHVITAHLHYLAQAKPNETIQFIMATQKEAEVKQLQQQQYLLQIQKGSTFKMDKLLYEAH